MNTPGLADSSLAILFTRGISLDTWDRIGSFSREVALYRSVRNRLKEVTLVTYGGSRDRRFLPALGGIGVACNRWSLPERVYVRLLSRLHRDVWKNSTIIKSLQVWGADIGLAIARSFGKKYVARCGYLASDFVEQRYGAGSAKAQEVLALEERVFKGADRIVVTTDAMNRTVVDRYEIDRDKIRVIPNFVDVDVFRPPGSDRGRNVLCFVGRLEQQKNLFALLDAVQDMDVELLIAGNGSQKQALMDRSKQIRPDVRFVGNVPHERLPALLGRATVFVLPSFIEGHPKSLLEAMSCGAACVGADVPGIRELIRHRETGYLCGTEPDQIRKAIGEALDNPELSLQVGRNAREMIERSFSLDRVVALELEMLNELAGR